MEGIKPLNYSKLWLFLRKSLKIERTYILPTKLGLYYAILCFILLAVAFIYGNNIAYFSCFMLSSLGIVTIFQTNFNLHRVKLKVLPLLEVHADQPVSYKLSIENTSNLSSFQLFIRLEQGKFNRNHLYLKDISQEVILIPQLGPNQKKEIEFSLVFTQRGYHRPPIIILESRFPLGLLRSWKWIHPEESILIFPSKIGQLPIPKLALDGIGDVFEKWSSLNEGLEFIGHRPYQNSDSIRKVDWKAYSRNQKLNVKLYESEDKSSFLLNWESTQVLKDIESRISQLTFWIHDCHRRKVDFVLQLPQWKSECGHSKDIVRECYKNLALFQVKS